MHTYLIGPLIEKAATPDRAYGRYGPDGTEGLINLPINNGPPTQQYFISVPQGTSYDNTVYTFLGSGDFREINVTGNILNTWQSILGYRPNGNTLYDIVRDHLLAVDPVIIPTTEGNLEIWLGGHSLISREKFDPRTNRNNRYWNRLRQKIRSNYRRIFNGISPEWADKYLDAVVEKTFREKDFEKRKDPSLWTHFVPPELQQETPGPKKRSTSYSDDYNRASLGTNWKNYNRLSPYAENISAYSIVSNVLNKVLTYDAFTIYQSAVSSDDHEVYARRVNSSGNNFGPLARAASASWGQQGYYAFQWGTTLYLRLGDGTDGDLGSHFSGSWTDWVKVYPNGSTIKAYNGGTGASPSWTERISVTNSAYSGGLYGGWGNWNTGLHTGDDWTIDDLTAGTVTVVLDSPEVVVANSVNNPALSKQINPGTISVVSSVNNSTLLKQVNSSAISISSSTTVITLLKTITSGNISITGGTNSLTLLKQISSNTVSIVGNLTAINLLKEITSGNVSIGSSINDPTIRKIIDSGTITFSFSLVNPFINAPIILTLTPLTINSSLTTVVVSIAEQAAIVTIPSSIYAALINKLKELE